MTARVLSEQLHRRSYQLTSIKLQEKQILGEVHEFRFECAECNMSIQRLSGDVEYAGSYVGLEIGKRSPNRNIYLGGFNIKTLNCDPRLYY